MRSAVSNQMESSLPAAAIAGGYADSVDSSPRSRTNDSCDESLPQIGTGGAHRLRFMCSYGGRIVPRPHDKTLCYLGGDTRMVVVDRQSSLSDLSLKLSRNLLSGRSFTLKYQIPNEDLDSLISVTTDEDLENMIEEYDRISSNSTKPIRLRLFLFPVDSVSSIGSLLDDSKSESWFFDALNGSGIMRGLSSGSNSVNCLLGLDDTGTASGGEMTAVNKAMKQMHDVHSVPDSPIVETGSSFGSTSSAPYLSNLPPIRVRVDDGNIRPQESKPGLEEQFGQVNIGNSPAPFSGLQKNEEGCFVVLSPPTAAVNVPVIPHIPSASPTALTENNTTISSEDERLEHGFSVTTKKTQPQPLKTTNSSPDLPSPDSISRDNGSTFSHPKAIFYQESVAQVASKDRVSIPPAPVNPTSDFKSESPDSSYRIPIPVHDQAFILPQPDQNQFIHANPQYIHHQATGSVPISSYYQIHPLAQNHQMEPQIPVYYVPIGQNPSYPFPIQSNLSEAPPMVANNKPSAYSNFSAPPTYIKDPIPSYSSKVAAPKPELTSNIYRSPAPVHQFLHIPSQQSQPHVGYHHLHHPIGANPGNLGYIDQLFYAQASGPTALPQYQTLTSGTMVMEASSIQIPPDSANKIRTSQA